MSGGEEYATKRYKGCDPITKKTKVKAKLRFRGKKKPGWVPFKAQFATFTPTGKAGKDWQYCLFNLGKISVKFKCTREDFFAVKHCAGDFSQDCKGNWYINVSVEYVITNPVHPKKGSSSGLDLNLGADKQVVDSEGNTYGHNLAAEKIAQLNRVNERIHHLKYSKTVRGLIQEKKDLSKLVYDEDSKATPEEKVKFRKRISELKAKIGEEQSTAEAALTPKQKAMRQANIRKNYKILGKTHYRVSAKGDEFVHKTTNTFLAAAETINFGNGLREGLTQTRFARSYLAISPSRLFKTLSYKSIENGSTVKKVDEHYSTVSCSVCLSQTDKVKGIEKLSVRQWTCDHCGADHGRDHNSAKIINMIGNGIVKIDFKCKKLVWELHTMDGV